MPGSSNARVDMSMTRGPAAVTGGIRILPAPPGDTTGIESAHTSFRPEHGLSRFTLTGLRPLERKNAVGSSGGSIETPPVDWLSGVAPHVDEAGPRRMIQRQSHTKSRNGCHSCKNRRIKCDESRPVCAHCMKRGFKCEWPDLQIWEARESMRRGASSSAEIIQQPSSNSTFTAQDFRLFYHFIHKAYPHQPIGNDSIWTHEIPSIAHDYEFLLHAMLALSAADLAERECKQSELACYAISHRVKAIRSLNQALAKGVQSFEAGNAMLGACYSLLFQSIFMEDGLPEFMTFLRGVVLVAFNMGMNGIKFLFHSMLGWQQLEKMDPHLQGSPGISHEPVNAATQSLEAFEPLIERQFEKDFHGLLMQMAHHIHTSSKEAYKGLMDIYQAFSWTMTNENFKWFINPSNEVGQLLQCHLIGLQLLFSPIAAKEQMARNREQPSNTTVHWLRGIQKNIPPHLHHYVEWPLAMGAKVREEEASRPVCTNEENKSSGTFWDDGAGQEAAAGPSWVSELESWE